MEAQITEDKMKESRAVVKAQNMSFKYMESTEGISDINFEINKGEIVLLTGNSGSGKSTLLKCLNGLIPSITEGELQGFLSIDGDKTSDLKMHELNKKIGSVFQNPRSQFFTDNTTAELVFPMENYGFSKDKMEERLQELKKAFGIENLMDRNIYSLSSGERQMVALASAVTMHQRILLFDEPSANLDYGNAMKLGRIMDSLKKKGYTIIVADHRFYYLNGRLDKILFMEEGKLTVFDNEEKFKKSGYSTRSFDIFSLNIPFSESVREKNVVAEMSDVSYKNILHDINIKLYKNEVVGLVGKNGVGKTTFAKLLCDSFKPDIGKIKKNNLPFFIMQDPDYQLFGTSVANELTLVKNNQKEINEILDYLGLGPYKNKHPFDLSGGQKQRLQIAMAMLCDKEIIIFDEPTSGLDVYSMEKVAQEIKKLRERSSVIVISHDYEFLRHVADRIVYMEEGTIKDDFILEADAVSSLNNIFNKMEDVR